MDKLIPEMYKSYGKYVNAFRSFPLDIDGLKPVERRVLLTAYLVARDKLSKSARVDGNCIARFHPHGSAYGTIAQMVRQGFLIGQGNFGNDLGVEPSPPAAMRYTECKLDPRTIELMFKYIKNVPWVESELDDEPLYLPTMYPVCLMGTDYTQGIGFGYRTYIPCYTVTDLHRRLLWLLGKRKTEPVIYPISDCNIAKKQDTELKLLLTEGKAKIAVLGVIQIDPKKCKAWVNSWPPGSRFATILNKFKSELDVGDIGFMDLSNQENGTKIEFSVLKQRNRDRIFKNFVKKLVTTLTGSISFETNTVDIDGKVNLTSIDDLLLRSYDFFTKVNQVMLETKMKETEDHILENQFLEMIKPFLSDALKSGEKNPEKLIATIAKKAKTDPQLVKAMFQKYRIQKLLSVNTDISELQKKLKELSKNLKNLEKFVLDQYQGMK